VLPHRSLNQFQQTSHGIGPTNQNKGTQLLHVLVSLSEVMYTCVVSASGQEIGKANTTVVANLAIG